jgi:drug/metabolite transporter (DMT)-like permease
MNQRTKSIMLLLLTGLLWSIGGVFIKANDANPFVISSVRGLVAAIVFLIALKGRPKMTWSKPQILGALAYSGVLTTFVLATKLTSAANAILLEYTSPIFVAILAWLILRERLRGYDILAIAGVVVGMWLLMSNNLSGGHMAGNVIGVGTGVCYAIFVICLRLQKDVSPYETVFLGNIFTFLIGVPFFFLAPPAPASLLPVVFLGVFQIAIPYLLLTYASKNAKALDITLFTILEPLLNPVWVFLYTGENPGIRTVLGGAVLLAVVILKAVFALRQTPTPPQDKGTDTLSCP